MTLCAQQQRVRLGDAGAGAMDGEAEPAAAEPDAAAGAGVGAGSAGGGEDNEQAAAAVAAIVQAAVAAVLDKAAAADAGKEEGLAGAAGAGAGEEKGAASAAAHTTASMPGAGQPPLTGMASATKLPQAPALSASPSGPDPPLPHAPPPGGAHRLLPLVLGTGGAAGEVRCQLSLEGKQGPGLTLPCTVRSESCGAGEEAVHIVLQVRGGQERGGERNGWVAPLCWHWPGALPCVMYLVFCRQPRATASYFAKYVAKSAWLRVQAAKSNHVTFLCLIAVSLHGWGCRQPQAAVSHCAMCCHVSARLGLCMARIAHGRKRHRST